MTEKMKEIMEYLQECNNFFLATVEDGKPFVRPISVLCEHDNKIYFISSNHIVDHPPFFILLGVSATLL